MTREEFLNLLKVGSRFSKVRCTEAYLTENNLIDTFNGLTKDVASNDFVYKLTALKCNTNGRCKVCDKPLTIHKGKMRHFCSMKCSANYRMGGKPAHNRAQVDEDKIVECYNNGMSMMDIMRQDWCIVSNATIKKILVRNGVEFDRTKHVRRGVKIDFNNPLIDDYFNQGMSVHDMMQIYGCSDRAIQTELINRGLKDKSDQTSHIERVLDKHQIQYITHDRKILNGLEIDLYLPDYKIGIECNGLYWHSTNTPQQDVRHVKKFETALEANIKLLQFWEHDIERRTSLIESMILARCGLTPNKVMARKCEVVDMPISQANHYFKQWHIQGETTHQAKAIALSYKGDIVAILAYTKSGDTIRIERYACKLFHNVVGGYSKLESKLDADTLVTFSLNLISNGELYAKNGYTSTGYNLRPEFYVTDCFNVYSRHKFMKHKLQYILEAYDPNKTEWQNLVDNEFRLLFGAGITKWTKKRL